MTSAASRGGAGGSLAPAAGTPAASSKSPSFQAANELSSSRGMKRAYAFFAALPLGGGTLRNSLDILVVAAGREDDGAFLDQAAHHLQHFLLLGLDLRQAHRAARLELLAQRLGGTRRHVAEDLVAH